MVKQTYSVGNFNFPNLKQAELFENIINKNKFNNKQKNKVKLKPYFEIIN